MNIFLSSRNFILSFFLVFIFAISSPGHAQDKTFDPILSEAAYRLIFVSRGGDDIRVEFLYDDDKPAQKRYVLKEFGNRENVSLEDIYRFIRKRFNLLAINRLSISPEHSLRAIENLSKSEQDDFIRQNEFILRKVSAAFTQNIIRLQTQLDDRRQKWPQDFELLFKSFDQNAPSFEQAYSTVKQQINDLYGALSRTARMQLFISSPDNIEDLYGEKDWIRIGRKLSIPNHVIPDYNLRLSDIFDRLSPDDWAKFQAAIRGYAKEETIFTYEKTKAITYTSWLEKINAARRSN